MNRITGIMTLVLAVVCVTPYSSIAAPTLEQISSYEKKMIFHVQDLLQIEKSIPMEYWPFSSSLRGIAKDYLYRLGHIADLLLISLSVHNPDDKELVKLFIIGRMKSVADGINSSLEELNLSISTLKNQAAIATGIKLRDDLRALKELLLSPN